MRNGWRRVGAVVGVIGVLGLAACEADVETPEGDVNVEEPAGEGEGEGEGGGD